MGGQGTSTLSHSGRGAGTELGQSAWQPIGGLFVMFKKLIDSSKWWPIINTVHDHTTGMLNLDGRRERKKKEREREEE